MRAEGWGSGAKTNPAPAQYHRRDKHVAQNPKLTTKCRERINTQTYVDESVTVKFLKKNKKKKTVSAERPPVSTPRLEDGLSAGLRKWLFGATRNGTAGASNTNYQTPGFVCYTCASSYPGISSSSLSCYNFANRSTQKRVKIIY